MAKTYVVTAPLAIVRNSEQGGRHEYLYQGAPLPGYVAAEERDRLVDAGLVAAQGDAGGTTPATSPDQLNPAVLVAPSAPSRQPAAPPVRTMSDGDDPGDFTVEQVNAHLANADDAERTRVIEAEAAGKNRASITSNS
jgi:hypothetical protein